MKQRSCNAYVVRSRARRPRILIEDDRLDLGVLDLSPPGGTAFEIVVCNGPEEGETCPLVMRCGCPAGRPDVVVSHLSENNPWKEPVRSAWAAEGVPVIDLDATGPLEWPAHVGAAVQAFFPED